MPEPTLQESALIEVAHNGLAQWDLDIAEMTLHSQGENIVFRVEATGGELYALRIHRPGYHNLAELESEQICWRPWRQRDCRYRQPWKPVTAARMPQWRCRTPTRSVTLGWWSGWRG